MREEENITDEKVWGIDREKALMATQRIENIVRYILEHFNQKTKYNEKEYNHTVVSNIGDVASKRKEKIKKTAHLVLILFLQLLPLKQQKILCGISAENGDIITYSSLKVTTIFSFGVNEEEPEIDSLITDENPEDTSRLDISSRDFLDASIKDYNRMFGTSYETSSEKFQNYYKDVSLRVKNRKIDLLIVVNMFLTGFDAIMLNTLWVDKNLCLHGLLQSYSRTNRILNSIKTFGNVVCFRNLEKATNESITLFGNREVNGIVLLKTYDEYYHGYRKQDGEERRGYEKLITELRRKYPMIGEQIVGEEAQKEFIRLYGAILKVKNILSSFDEFEENEVLTECEVQEHHSMYIDMYNEFRGKKKGDSENVNDDIVFEMELIKQVEINIDYILDLIRKYHASVLQDKEIVGTIEKAIDSSMELRNKKDLIEQFIASLTSATQVDESLYTKAGGRIGSHFEQRRSLQILS
jgi:type I restriction enzyme R subunit